MALQLPNIYTLGQVQVNTQPLAQLQGQLLAKKQAREEALDKYFEGKTKEITKKGIADNDVPGYETRLKKLQNYWTENKADISRGGMSQRNFEYMVDDLKDYTGKSIGKKQDLGKVYELRIKGDINDDDIPLIGKIEAPIDAPTRLKPNGMPYGLGDFSAAVALPDTQKQNQFWGAVSQDYKPKLKEYQKDAQGNISYMPTMPGSFKKIAKFTERFSDDQIKGMADRAADFASTDKPFRKLYSTVLNNPQDPKFAELKAVYDQYYPGDIMDKPEEVAKADAILRFKNFQNPGQDEFVDERAKEAYSSALISSRQKAAGGGQINLSEYPEVPNKGRDVTDLMQGVTVFQAPDGTKLSASKVYYNPSTKQINYEALAGRDANGKIVKGEPKSLSLNTFLQNIKTLNPGTDFKFVETLSESRVPGKARPKGGRTGADVLN